ASAFVRAHANVEADAIAISSTAAPANRNFLFMIYSLSPRWSPPTLVHPSRNARGRCARSRGAASPAARRPARRGRGAEPARRGQADRGADRRADARVRRGGRQESPPPLRQRPDAAQPPAAEGTLVGAAARPRDPR